MSESTMRGVTVDGAEQAGFDPDELRRAFGLLEGWVEDGILPGAGALVARGGVVAGETYVGMAHREQRRPSDSDTMWSLASITKPFIATSVMLLVEQGVLSLDEPLYCLVPEFLRAPETAFDRRAVTLRHLLSHCSGLSGVSEDDADLRRAHRLLEDFVRSFLRQPLFFAPTTAHLYSNMAIAIAAEVVGRALAGTLGQECPVPAVRRLHEFVHERILAPLGMASSTMLPPAGWEDRIAWVERTGYEGLDWEPANSAYYRSLGIPSGGMYSRPRDLIRFVDVFLLGAGGRRRIGGDDGASGPRVLAPATVRAMTTVQYGPPRLPQTSRRTCGTVGSCRHRRPPWNGVLGGRSRGRSDRTAPAR